jgi:hypothetical protein
MERDQLADLSEPQELAVLHLPEDPSVNTLFIP